MSFANDRQRCAHLLRRFGLGASEAELEFYAGSGVEGAVDKLLNYESVDEGFAFDVENLKNPKGRLNAPSVSVWWTIRLLVTRRPLQERMTLFWHDHFATSAAKVNGARLMLQQNELLRANATGTFHKLLSEVSKDPAMILWLDNQQNVKDHPNENFAREVMELFTLGIGHYTEKDVQEGARAFTGWGIQRSGVGPEATAEFVFRPVRHDPGPKEFLGRESNFEGDDVLSILCDQPRTAEHIATKIWDWFVWPKPEPRVVAPFVQRFQESGLDIKKLLRDIMTSKEFYSVEAQRAIVKNPVDICVVTLREMGVGEQIRQALAAAPPPPPAGQTMQADAMSSFPRAAIAPAFAANRSMRAMGMWLLYPPDVHGWDNGNAWITSQTMLERVSWGDRLFGQAKSGPQFPYPAAGLFTADPTPDGVVHRLVSLFDAPMKPEHRAILVEAAKRAAGASVTPETAAPTAAAVARLIFASPEFQLS